MSEDTYRRLHWCNPDDHNDHDDHENHDDDHDEYIFRKRIFQECIILKYIFWKCIIWKCIFLSVFVSVTRRSRSDESHSLTDWVTELLSVSIDFTDVTLVSEDTYRRLHWYDPDDRNEHDDHDDHDNHDDDHDEYIFWKRIFRECVFWKCI